MTFADTCLAGDEYHARRMLTDGRVDDGLDRRVLFCATDVLSCCGRWRFRLRPVGCGNLDLGTYGGTLQFFAGLLQFLRRRFAQLLFEHAPGALIVGDGVCSRPIRPEQPHHRGMAASDNGSDIARLRAYCKASPG